MQDPHYVKEAFRKIATRYIFVNHVLSLGADILWRKKAARIVKNWKPRSILDLATGTGDLALELQRKCPQAEITGADFSEEMLAIAKRRGLRKTAVVDAMNMPFKDKSYDVLSVAFGLRNMESWPIALIEMHRLLKSGGHLLVLDFSVPNGLFHKPYLFYLKKMLPRIAGIITGQADAYRYLASSIEQFPSGKNMVSMIEKSGFSDVECFQLSFGVASIYSAKVE